MRPIPAAAPRFDRLRWLPLLLALALPLLAPPAVAQNQDPPPGTAAKVAELRQALTTATDLDDATREKVEAAMSRAEIQLAAAEQYHRRLAELRATLADANSVISRIQGRLSVGPDRGRSRYLTSVSALETATDEAQQRVDTASERYDQAAAESKRLETLRKELPDKLEALRAQLALPAATNGDAAPSDEPPLLREAQLAAATAERERAQAEYGVLSRQNQNINLLARLAKAQEDLAKSERDAALQDLESLEGQLREARTREVTQKVSPARDQAAKAPAALKQLADANLETADALAQAAKDLGPALRDRRQVERQLARVEQDFREARTRVELVGLSEGVGQELRLLRSRMLTVRKEYANWSRVRTEIVKAYDTRFRTDDQLEQLEDFDAAVAEALTRALARLEADGTEPTDEQRGALRTAARELLNTRLDLLQTLATLQEELTNALVATDSTLATLRERLAECLDFATERVLWVPSAAPVWSTPLAQEMEDVRTTPSELGEALWSAFHEDTLASLAGSKTVLGVLASLLLLLLIRRPLKARLAEANQAASRRSNTSIAPSLRAVLCLALLSLAVPIAMVLVSSAVDAVADAAPNDGQSGPRLAAIASGLRTAAMVAFLLGFLRRSAHPDALLQIHLNWPREACRLLVRRLRWLNPVLVLTSLSLASVAAAESQIWTRSAGRVSLVVAALSVSIAGAALLHPNRGVLALGRDERNALTGLRTRHVLHVVALTVPLLLAGLSLAGYQFTALILWTRLLSTIALVLVMLLIHGLVVRWMLLSQRALAISRAREAHRTRAAQAVATAADGPEIPIDHAADLARVDQQTETVVRVIVQLTAVLGLWFLWVDVLPALGILEQFELWDEQVRVTQVVTNADGVEELVSKDVVQAVTLERLLAALVILVATWFLARNVGGFIEVAVLRHTSMQSGERYATRTIANYAVGLTGIAMALGTIGLGWDKVQWLLAAVSVGLGFGMQEIFANFVSGLILLLERPIRVGDLVTVGDTDGRVTRIQMRATTITDWDRKELVVPNREFITSRFVNWSLTNPLTRLVIPVGVAYGSDTRLAAKLLEDAADECSVVMASPKPTVVFKAFGGSSLDLELRLFIASMDDWLAAMNDVHRNIDDKFKAAGIEIAFPQQDLHVRSLPKGFTGPPTPPTTPVVAAPEADRAAAGQSLGGGEPR